MCDTPIDRILRTLPDQKASDRRVFLDDIVAAFPKGNTAALIKQGRSRSQLVDQTGWSEWLRGQHCEHADFRVRVDECGQEYVLIHRTKGCSKCKQVDGEFIASGCADCRWLNA